MKASNLEVIRSIPFPSARYYSVFASNSIGSVVAGFGCEKYYDEDLCEKDQNLYYFTDVQP